jgi:hypothetical protein
VMGTVGSSAAEVLWFPRPQGTTPQKTILLIVTAMRTINPTFTLPCKHFTYVYCMTVWNVRLCSPLKSTDISEEHVPSLFRVQEYAQQALLVTCFTTVSCLAYSWTLMEAMCSSKMLVDSHWTKQ